MYVFDLDHTLVHTLDEPVHGMKHFAFEDSGRTLYVHPRPHVEEFLTFLVGCSEMSFGFWTAGTRTYAKGVVDGLFRHAGIVDWEQHVAILFDRSHTTLLPCGQYVKPLNMVRRHTKTFNVVLVDDNPVHSRPPQNRGAVVRVPSFRATDGRTDAFLHNLTASMKDSLRRK